MDNSTISRYERDAVTDDELHNNPNLIPSLVRLEVLRGGNVTHLLDITDEVEVGPVVRHTDGEAMKSISAYLPVMCSSNEGLIYDAINRYRQVYGYLEWDEETEEPVKGREKDDEVFIAFINAAVECESFNQREEHSNTVSTFDRVYNVMEDIGENMGFMFGYYLVFYDTISWKLAFALYRRLGHEMTEDGIDRFRFEPDAQRGYNRLNELENPSDDV